MTFPTHGLTGISLQGKTTLEVMGALNDSIEIPGRSQVGVGWFGEVEA